MRQMQATGLGSKMESRYRYKLRFTVGEYKSHPYRPHYWRTDSKVDELLKYRPSINEMKSIIQPMCVLFFDDSNMKSSKVSYDDTYWYWLLQKLGYSSMKELDRLKKYYEDHYIKDIGKIRDYELQLSRQLVEYSIEKYSVPYQQQK